MVLSATAGGGVEGSDSCCGGWWSIGYPGVHGVRRPVLLNHLAQPFGKVEVGPDGDEALCSGAGKERIFIPIPRPELRDKESLGLEGFSI